MTQRKRRRIGKPVDSSQAHLRRNTKRPRRQLVPSELLEARALLATDAFSAEASLPEHWQPAQIRFDLTDSPFATDADAARLQEVTGTNESVSTAQGNSRVVVFVDAAVTGYQDLIQSLDQLASVSSAVGTDAAGASSLPNLDVVILQADRDGAEQISETLSRYQDVSTIHVFSHGSSGSLSLGNARLSGDTLEQYAEQVSGWKSALAAGADILLYGCNVADGEWGIDFVDRLRALTGADVAASNDLTGNAALNGDWVLEVQRGQIQPDSLISENSFDAYAHLLTDQVLTGSGRFIVTTTSATAPGKAAVPIAASPSNLVLNGNTTPDEFAVQGWGSVAASTTINGFAGADTVDLSGITENMRIDLEDAGGGAGPTAKIYGGSAIRAPRPRAKRSRPKTSKR